MGDTVTGRIKKIVQPRGGFINPRLFKITDLYDTNILSEDESIHPSLVGIAVDYLSRLMYDGNKSAAFDISMRGYSQLKRYYPYVDRTVTIMGYDAPTLLSNINGLDDDSIRNACRMVTYDVWYRVGPSVGINTKGDNAIEIDQATIENIRVMVNRVLNFFSLYGPVTKYGFTFGRRGYTDVVDGGDGDFLTKDCLWDLKVSKNSITKDHTLQLLMYWVMGIHSGLPEFENIEKLGVFNPRLNKVFQYSISNIPQEVITDVEMNVLGFTEDFIVV